MKRSIYPVVFLVISVVLFCNYPQDPTKNPVNAKAKFEEVNDEPPVVPIRVMTNDSVKISLYFFLEHFIDSIETGIYSTESNDKSDTVFCFKPPFSVEDNIVYIFFPKAGNKRCILTAVKTGGSRMSDTLVFEVIQKNRAPVWSLDTIPVVSKKGAIDECDLNEFVNDPDDDPVVIENQGSLPDGFSFSSGVLSNEIATDSGLYFFEILASDDSLSAVVVVRWEILPDSGKKDNDQFPFFVDPVEMVEIDEGKTKKQMFYAEHPIEEQVEISHVSKPDWVSIAGTMDSIELSISPGYEVASTSISSVQAKVVLKVSSSGLDVEHELIIQVKNVNRAPEFISFPDDISSRMGELFESSQIEITDDDGDEVSVELVSAPGDMETGTDNKIRWFIPRIGYMPGNQVTVTVRISDNDTFVENSFILTIDPHKWLLVNNEGIEIRGEMDAAGRDTLFYTASGANPSIYRSIDGGESWEDLPYVNFGSMSSYAKITKMVIRGSTVFVSGPSSSGSYLSGFYATFPIDNPQDTSIVSTGKPNSFDVSPDGKRVVTQHGFLENYNEKPYFYYKDEGLVRSKDSIFGQIPAIASGNSNIWAYINNDTQKSVYLMTDYDYEESDSLGFKYHAYVADSVTGVYIGDENGDTAFVIFDDSKKIMCSYSGGGYKTINLDPEITPAALCLVSGSVGWVLDKEGDVWYSNNSFKEIAREILEDSRGNKAKITGIFKSSDGETVFAYSRDANNIVKIYRY